MRVLFSLLMLAACDGSAEPADGTPDDTAPPTVPAGDIQCGVSWFWVNDNSAEQWTEPMSIAAEVDGDDGFAITLPTRQGPAANCRIPFAWTGTGWAETGSVTCATPCSGAGDVGLDLVDGTSDGDVMRLTVHMSEGTCSARANVVCDTRLEPGEGEEPLAQSEWAGDWSCLVDWHRSEGPADVGWLQQPEDAGTSGTDEPVFEFGGCSVAVDDARVATMTATPSCSDILTEEGSRVSDAAVAVVGDAMVAHVQYTLEEAGVGYALGSYSMSCRR